jgi:uncharacterized protein (DUF2345 family)
MNAMSSPAAAQLPHGLVPSGIIASGPKSSTAIDLAHGHSLAIDRKQGTERLEIVSNQGQVMLTIEMTPKGPVLKFHGASISVHTDGELTLDAKQLNLQGRESVNILSGDEINLEANGHARSKASVQQIIAADGNVNIKANDDVRISSERCIVNCDTPDAIPRHILEGTM